MGNTWNDASADPTIALDDMVIDPPAKAAARVINEPAAHGRWRSQRHDEFRLAWLDLDHANEFLIVVHRFDDEGAAQ